MHLWFVLGEEAWNLLEAVKRAPLDLYTQGAQPRIPQVLGRLLRKSPNYGHRRKVRETARVGVASLSKQTPSTLRIIRYADMWDVARHPGRHQTSGRRRTVSPEHHVCEVVSVYGVSECPADTSVVEWRALHVEDSVVSAQGRRCGVLPCVRGAGSIAEGGRQAVQGDSIQPVTLVRAQSRTGEVQITD
jgi:hypothetical protein